MCTSFRRFAAGSAVTAQRETQDKKQFAVPPQAQAAVYRTVAGHPRQGKKFVDTDASNGQRLTTARRYPGLRETTGRLNGALGNVHKYRYGQDLHLRTDRAAVPRTQKHKQAAGSSVSGTLSHSNTATDRPRHGEGAQCRKGEGQAEGLKAATAAGGWGRATLRRQQLDNKEVVPGQRPEQDVAGRSHWAQGTPQSYDTVQRVPADTERPGGKTLNKGRQQQGATATAGANSVATLRQPTSPSQKQWPDAAVNIRALFVSSSSSSQDPSWAAKVATIPCCPSLQQQQSVCSLHLIAVRVRCTAHCNTLLHVSKIL